MEYSYIRWQNPPTLQHGSVSFCDAVLNSCPFITKIQEITADKMAYISLANESLNFYNIWINNQVLNSELVWLKWTCGLKTCTSSYPLKTWIISKYPVWEIAFSCKITMIPSLTHKQLEMYGCVLSPEATDGLVLNHQAISIHSAE